MASERKSSGTRRIRQIRHLGVRADTDRTVVQIARRATEGSRFPRVATRTDRSTAEDSGAELRPSAT